MLLTDDNPKNRGVAKKSSDDHQAEGNVPEASKTRLHSFIHLWLTGNLRLHDLIMTYQRCDVGGRW